MRRTVVAEWILTLIVPRQAAAAIVGDLVEGDAVRGGTWFWSSVAGTVARQTLQQIVRVPGFVLFMTGISWFTYMAVGLVFAIGSLIVAPAVAFTINLLAEHTLVGLLVSSVSAADTRVALEMVSLWALAPVIVGAMLARTVRGFELPMAFLTSASWPLLAALIPFVAHNVRASDGMLLVIPCLIAGAIRERRVAQTA